LASNQGVAGSNPAGRTKWALRSEEFFVCYSQSMKSGDIYKASGIILIDRKVLVERSKGKDHFVHPGGKIEPGETAKQAVVRELKEEFSIDVREEDLAPFDKNSAPAAHSPEVDVHMEVFLVKRWQGDITPDNEVEEIRWLTSDVPKDIKIGSIMEYETIPKLKAANLID
jgi:8-oxo-dGTP diphosphatase